MLQFLVEDIAFKANKDHLVLLFHARALIDLACLARQLICIHFINIAVVLLLQLFQLLLNFYRLGPERSDVLVQQYD